MSRYFKVADLIRPTAFKAGSKEKIALLRARALAGLPLFHPQDATAVARKSQAGRSSIDPGAAWARYREGELRRQKRKRDEARAAREQARQRATSPGQSAPPARLAAPAANAVDEDDVGP
jgi:hypothetical protein